MQKQIVETVKNLKPSQAVHLGHSMVIGNFGGIIIGFDLSTQNGMIPMPFASLALNSDKIISHLLPLPEKNNLIATANEIAKHLNILVYSHLHSDHFSLSFIAEAIKANPKIKIICPPNTKSYLEQTGQIDGSEPFNLFLRPIASWLQKNNRNAIDDLLKDVKTNASKRKQIIEQIQEISFSSPTYISKGKQSINIKAFPTVHPAFQFYIRMPFEFNPPPLTVGYKIFYEDTSDSRCAIFVGEGASDPYTLSEVFSEREQLSIVFFPITEQIHPKGKNLIEEFMVHSSIRTLAMVEKIVTEKTKIVPLHQGFWYFQLNSNDIVKGRDALRRLATRRKYKLPFVSLTREFQTIQERHTGNYYHLNHILLSIRHRWRIFKKLATIVNLLPINGLTENLPLGSTIDFSISEKAQPEKPLSKESLQSAFQALIAEWQVMHMEIDRNWALQGIFYNYILLIIGSVITLVSVFPNLELLFIVASFILSLTGWAMIEKLIHTISIGRFYTYELTPRANIILREMENLEPHNPVADKLRVLLWEGFFRGKNRYIAIQGFASLGRYLMSTVPGFASAMTFLYLKQSSSTVWSYLEVIAVVVATGMSLLPLITAAINARYAYSGEE